MRSIFLLLALGLLISCDSKTEKVEEVDEAGFRSVYNVDKENGLMEGSFKQYNEEGNLFIEATYREGQLDGTRKFYYPDGTVMREDNHKAGLFDGPYKDFFADGTLGVDGQYKQNKHDGLWTYFYANGNKKEEVNFVDGIEDGPFTEYYESGKIHFKGSYKAGVNKYGMDNTDDPDKEHGRLEEFSEEGELIRLASCEFGICETQWTPDSTNLETPKPEL